VSDEVWAETTKIEERIYIEKLLSEPSVGV